MAIPFVDLKIQYEELKEEITQRIQNVLNHSQFILGPEVKELEEKLKEFVGSPYALTCSNGTDALLMALMACDIQPGDEVITTPFSFIATAETISLLKAVPVFVDIDPQTYNINPSAIEKAITPKTKAIIPVSLYGQPAEMDDIQQISQQHNLTVIEDGAQSFGATYKKRRSGNLSPLATTSFFPAKPFGCYGDGGAIFCSDSETYEKLHQIRNHGQGKVRYEHIRLGMNGRMNTLQCAILLAKFPHYPQDLELRQKAADYYLKNLEELSFKEKIQLPYVKPHCSSAWAQFTIQVPNRPSFQSFLKEKGIPTAVHYPKLMSDQPSIQNHPFKALDLSIAKQVCEKVVSLPIYAQIPQTHQDKVIESIYEYFKTHS